MRLVEWTDDDGFKRAALVRDNDPDEARESGIPLGPPDLYELDWDAIRCELHNELMNRRLFTWNDVVAAQDGLTNTIKRVLKRRLVTLYRQGPGNSPG